MKDLWIVFWWSGGQRKLPDTNPGVTEWITPPSPYGSVFENEAAAEAAANVRNAMVIHVRAKGIIEVEGADWYRRDDEGKPMPVEWRDLIGNIHATPSGAKPKMGPKKSP